MAEQQHERHYKLLVVEDDSATRIYLHSLFSRRGLEVTAAENGDEAIAILNQDRFDMVITDLRMTGTDGHGVLDYMAEHHPLTPTVVLTGATTISAMLDCLREGALAFVPKPLTDPQPLIDAIDLAVTLVTHRNHQLLVLVARNKGEPNSG